MFRAVRLTAPHVVVVVTVTRIVGTASMMARTAHAASSTGNRAVGPYAPYRRQAVIVLAVVNLPRVILATAAAKYHTANDNGEQQHHSQHDQCNPPLVLHWGVRDAHRRCVCRVWDPDLSNANNDCTNTIVNSIPTFGGAT